MKTQATRFLVAMFLLAAIPAHGHAILVKSSPAANSVVTGRAMSIVLIFNSRIDGQRSSVNIVGPDGSEHPLPLGIQNSPETLGSYIQDLQSGSYRLIWQVLAVDGHITRGEIVFSVQAR